MKSTNVLLLLLVFTFTILSSCTKEEILIGDYVSPVGETTIVMFDLPEGKVFGYLTNQNGEEFLAEFIVPETMIDGMENLLSTRDSVIIRYHSISQEYVEDESGMFSEEHDLVPAEDNLEVILYK